MAAIKIFGISQCSTVKKARQWLSEHQISAEFIDFKKTFPCQKDIELWLSQIPRDILINRKGTTWRKLSLIEQQTALSCNESAINLMIAKPSIIKRPVLIYKNKIIIGFNPELYTEIFAHQSL